MMGTIRHNHHHPQQQLWWRGYLSVWITLLCFVLLSDTVLQTANGLSSTATLTSGPSVEEDVLQSMESPFEPPQTLATRRGELDIK